MRFNSIVKTVFLFVFFSFGGYAVAFAQVNMEAERKILLDTDYEFARTSVKKGPSAAFYLYLADNAMQLPEGSLPIYGKNAIYETMKGDHYDLLWTPVKADVASSGDLGWGMGTHGWVAVDVELPEPGAMTLAVTACCSLMLVSRLRRRGSRGLSIGLSRRSSDAAKGINDRRGAKPGTGTEPPVR